MRLVVIFIVLFVLLPLPAVNSQGSPSSYIFHNGTILTVNASNDVAQAILVRNNVVEAIGTDQEILALRDDRTAVIDLDGKTIVPGFIDGHTHVLRNRPANMSLDEAQDVILSYGITTVGELSADQGYIDELLAAEEAGEIRVRINVFPEYNNSQLDNGQTIIQQLWYQDHEPILEVSRRVRIPGIKFFLDGVFDPQRGCMAMTEPFAIDVEGICFSDNGDAYFTQDQLNQAVADVQAHGYRAAMHAFGDRAIDMGLDAIQFALDGKSNEEIRHQIHHNSALRTDQISRFAGLAVPASLRGYFNTCDWDVYPDTYGAERGALAANRFGLPQSGVLTFLEGDFAWTSDPADKTVARPINPILGLYGLVTHQQLNADGTACLPPPALSQYVISIEDALRIATINGAYAFSMENVIGSLEVGKFADLVILSDNPMDFDPQRLHDIQALMTMVDGRVEFCRSGYERLCGADSQENVLFYEDFSDNSADWEEFEIELAYSKILDGEYVIVFTADQFNGWGVQPGINDWSKAPLFTEPYEASLEVSNLATTSGSYCLLFDFDLQPDPLLFKRFRVCADDSWAFLNWQNETLSTIADGSTPVHFELLDSLTHVLSIEVTEANYSFSVDGTPVATVNSLGPINGSVRFGLIRGNDQYTVMQGTFDNLTVRALN